MVIEAISLRQKINMKFLLLIKMEINKKILHYSNAKKSLNAWPDNAARKLFLA